MKEIKIKSNKYIVDLMTQYHETSVVGLEKAKVHKELFDQYQALQKDIEEKGNELKTMEAKMSNLATKLLELVSKEIKSHIGKFDYAADIRKIEGDDKNLIVVIRNKVTDYEAQLEQQEEAEKKAKKALAKKSKVK